MSERLIPVSELETTANQEAEVHHIDWVVIQLTDTCQHMCPYCINSDGPHKRNVASVDMIQEILARFRPRKVEYTGGDPSTRFNLLLSGIELARESGAEEIMFNTNMELLNSEKVGKLEQAGLTAIHFALHTLDRERHKVVRGNRNASLDKVLENFDNALQGTNLDFIIEYVPMKLPNGENNLADLESVYKYVLGKREAYGARIKSLEIGNLIPRGRATLDMMLPLEEQVGAIEHAIEQPEMPIEIYCYGREATERLKGKGFVVNTCFAGRSMFYFTVDGKVLADNFTGVAVASDYRQFDGRSPLMSMKRPSSY